MTAKRPGGIAQWVAYRLGLIPAGTQTTEAERACLSRHALGRGNIVIIGVARGVTTRVLRRAMRPDGLLTAIDPRWSDRPGTSYERRIAEREIGKVPYGRVVFDRRPAADAAAAWTTPIDLLFIDGDHSWEAIDEDWRNWSPLVKPGGIVAVHDSRPVRGRPAYDSIRYTADVILPDRRFTVLEAVDGLTVLERITARPASRPGTP